MTATASVIPNSALLSFHQLNGVDVNITWQDMSDEIMAAEIGDHLVMPQANEPLTPTIAFGTGIDGFYSSAAGVVDISIAAALEWTISAAGLSGRLGGALLNEAPTATNPSVVPVLADPDTGIGGTANALANISGGVAGVIYKSDGTDVIQQVEANVGLTADTGSAQGSGVITSSYNVYTTVAVAADAATLPAVFGVGDLVYIKNDAAANAMDVFPATGDDLGEGGNTALSVAAGDYELFIGVVANATWTRLMFQARMLRTFSIL